VDTIIDFSDGSRRAAFSSQLKSEIVNILVVATRRSPHNSNGSHGTAFSSHLKFEIFNILGEGVGRADYFEYRIHTCSVTISHSPITLGYVYVRVNKKSYSLVPDPQIS
jgi:hypothetical protein